MALVLGIDVGTQGARAIVASTTGQVIAQEKCPFASCSLPNLPAGYVEQDPRDWWNATRNCVSSVVSQLHDPAEIVAVAVDSTSGTIVLLDEECRPLRSALMYNDRRSELEAGKINQVAEDHCRELGYRFQSSFALPKVLWLMGHEPAIWARTRHIVHAADYIVGQLTGVYNVSDPGNALKTGFDLRTFEWPPFIQKDLGIARNLMPSIIRTGEDIAHVSSSGAAETGLSESTRVVAGTTDGSADLFASGAREIGDWNTVLGTTLVLKGLARDPVTDLQGRGVYSHLHPMGYWMPGGASNSGARALDERFPAVDHRSFDRAALELSPTSLAVYPLVGEGERFPFNAPRARSFIEGAPASDQELYAAYLEGIACLERLAYDVLRSLEAPVGEPIYATGGGAQSLEWMQIRADMLNRQLKRPRNASAAMGSAIVAASRTLFSNIAEASEQMVQIDRTVEPRGALTGRYEQVYQRFLAACRRRAYIRESG